MQQLAETCEAAAATSKKTEKIGLVADYFRLHPVAAPQAAVFLSGRAFPAWEERTLQVGGTLLWRTVAELSAKGEIAMTAAYRRYGDLGSAAQELLEAKAPPKSSLRVADVAAAFDELARTSGVRPKAHLVKDLLGRATALEAKYIIKIIGGDLRIGLRESLVEEAIAKAFGESPAAVQRANMLRGSIAETLELAAAHSLSSAHMRLFHPLGFMLASPVADAEEALTYFSRAALEDKFDGVRAQAHCGGHADDRVRIFSRTLDEISGSFPELAPALRAFPDPVILDGEILAWNADDGHALPFSALQQRLGRKLVSEELAREIPVIYIVFDALYAGGELIIDRPLEARRKIIEEVFRSVPEGGFIADASVAAPRQSKLTFDSVRSAATGLPRVMLSASRMAADAAEVEEAFLAARHRGNEGLMIKDLDSPYSPGRRGKSWLKLKRELATLDVVVTAVEWGHGKRARLLSDYTFAVRDGDQLLDIGKAYSGLTDAEIAEMTPWFLEHTLEDRGFRRTVEPRTVLEVAFNNMTRSDRHSSGFALRFPRIVRLRPDKPPEEIDTLKTAEEIFEKQSKRGKAG
ncbi:MAG TPA: ATP-dependent DNA ligase [Terriglobales bacterium]